MSDPVHVIGVIAAIGLGIYLLLNIMAASAL